MKRLFFLLTVGLILLQSCVDNDPKPAPDYMIERFKNKPCRQKANFVRINLPDSIVYLSDTMDNVRRYDEFGILGVGAGLVDTANRFSVRFQFQNTYEPTDRSKFLFAGSYRFPSTYFETEIPVGILFSLDQDDKTNMSDGSIFYASPESNYFYVLGAYGTNFEMQICGTFDVMLDDTRGGTLVPATGEFQMTFNDYFRD